MQLALYNSSIQCSAIDSILTSITKCELKRKPSAFLHEAFFNMQEAKKAADLAQSACFEETKPLTTITSWSCRGCGNSDRSNLEISSDKSAFSCSKCGTIDNMNTKEKEFDTKQRTLVSTSAPCPMPADEFKDASKRRRAVKDKECYTKNVPSTLRSAQEKIGRVCDITEHMNRKDQKRMEKSIIHIHGVFSAVGFDPDTNPLCGLASSLVSTLFFKATAHANSCPNKCACFASMVRSADTKVIANSSVKHILDDAIRSADRGESYEQLSTFQVREFSKKLLIRMSSFLKCVSVVRDAEKAIKRIVEASADVLCTPCAIEEEIDEEIDEDRLVLAPHDADKHSEHSVDDFLQKLAVSIQAFAELGYIDSRTAHIAQQHVVGISAYDFIQRNSSWPADIVAVIVCSKIVHSLKLPTSFLRSLLKKTAKQCKIAIETVQRELDALPAPSGSFS